MMILIILNVTLYNNNNPMAIQFIEGQSLPNHSWPHLHLFANESERSSNQFRNDMCSAIGVLQLLFISKLELPL